MNFNYFVLFCFWFICPIVLWNLIPRNRLREALAALMIFQMLTWLFSFGLTFAGLLEAPVRIFKHATEISFTMEYVVFPTVAVFFQLYFPKNANILRRILHYLLWVGIILSLMLAIGTFTDIMVVKIDIMIRSFFNFIIELWLCRQYVLWVMQHPVVSKESYS